MQVPDHDTRDFVQMFRDITSSIRNSSQRLEHLKKLQEKQIEENRQAACMKLISDGNRVVILCTQVIKTFSTREGWWYIGIKGDGGVKSKGIRLLIEKEK